MATPDWSAPPRCLGCGYTVAGLGQRARCPECGRPFDLHVPRTYTVYPPVFGWKFWAPGLLAASIIALTSMAMLLLVFANWGWALWISVPLTAGCILGYRVHPAFSFLFAGIICIVVILPIGAVSMGAGGLFCAMILAGVVLMPTAVGVLVGLAVRLAMRSSGIPPWRFPWMLLFGAIPYAWALIEGQPPASRPVESISTVREIAAPPEEAWDAIVFYEEVTHEPPLILRVGLAHPLFTIGSAEAVGDVKTCVYNEGRITKRITEVVPGRRLAFEVIEQDIGYERDVRLVGGAFEFEEVAPGRTRVTLTTVYEPRLAPRLAWRWGERIAVHTLHDHVIEGIRREACAAPAAREEVSP